MTKTYTAFCQQTNGIGTIWIDSVQAKDLEEAKIAAQANCAADWDYKPEDVHVLGIAAGSVTILDWEDLYD